MFHEKIRKPESDKLTQFHMDIASSIQAVTEDIILMITRSMTEEYNIPNICLAGGVALNCVANGKILRDNKFSNIWIQPAAGDAGGSLGAALNYWYNDLDNKRVVCKSDSMKGSYLGPSYKNEHIESELNKLGGYFY